MDQQTVAVSERPEILKALDVLRDQQARTAACGPLDEVLCSLRTELGDIEAQGQSLVSRLESAQRMQRFEADRLIVLGKSTTPEHEKSSALVQELKAEAVTMEQRKREISARMEVIEGEKKAALLRSAETFRDECILLIRGAENSLASILDGTRDTLNALELQLGTSLYQPAQLTADERSDAWVTLNRLYSGRVR